MSKKEDRVHETNSGVRKTGTWKEIAKFGKKVEESLKKSQKSHKKSIERFSEWRPKIGGSKSDLKRKTVDEATLEEKKLEESSQGAKKDLKNASNKLAKATKKAANNEIPDKEILEASEEATKPIYSKIAFLIRVIESKIYSWITLSFNPYYFDTKDFSVDMKDKENNKFEMNVAVLEEEQREDLKNKFRDEN